MLFSRTLLKKKNKNKSTQTLSRFLFTLSQHPKIVVGGLSMVCLSAVASVYLMQDWRIWYNKVRDNGVSLTKNLGYRIDQIYVEGRFYAPAHDVLKATELKRGDALFLKDLESIKESIEEISWIEKAEIVRRFPGTIIIKLTERKPVAFWQHQQKRYLIDAFGVVIGVDQTGSFAKLPVVVGKDAPQNAPKVLQLLTLYPEVQKRITGLTRINQRRWDLHLNQKLVIKLPESNIEGALARLNFLLEAKKINLDEVKMIDLRLPKQLIAKVTQEAAVRLKLKAKEA
jgi:cell division protein FtsQ